MKLLMDADFLIKITKAGLKEIVCEHCKVFVPETVKVETVDQGKAKQCDDASVIDANIRHAKIHITQEDKRYLKGDDALVGIFHGGFYDAVATDDAKLIRKLKLHGIPFILPALCLLMLHKNGLISKKEARQFVEQIAPFISPDEYATTMLLLEGKI